MNVVRGKKQQIPNEVFGPRWLERHDTFGLEICPRIYAKNEYENTLNGNGYTPQYIHPSCENTPLICVVFAATIENMVHLGA